MEKSSTGPGQPTSVLAGPPISPRFAGALDALVAVGRQGQRADSEFFNPTGEWLLRHIRLLQDLPPREKERLLEEWSQIEKEASLAQNAGRAAGRAGPEAVVRLDTEGVAFYSQLGVARRSDLTHYFIDGFQRNRDALAFSEKNQELFAEVLPHITEALQGRFAAGNTVVQMDRQIGDAPGRTFHARQLLFGTRYLQIPYMWSQLTFDLAPEERTNSPDILEISLPRWLEDVPLPERLKDRVREQGLTQLVLKAPTKGLSLHLGFDYVGEHKMGPLSIAMFLVKQRGGVAVQAALSVARVRTQQGQLLHTGLITLGPSLHGKSTLTIMIELGNSELARLLRLGADPEEGVYPMNDDIVLLRPLPQPLETVRHERRFSISHAIDGTENNFYAVPFGLTREDDPITFEVLRGTREDPNHEETLENVPVDPRSGKPDFLSNPTRNMRMILPRQRLIERKGAQRLIEAITGGRVQNAVHVPMEDMDRVFWQGVMRQNTVIPPLRRLTLAQYVRVLMYGEAVQMGAAVGAIGRPYVEYFSDPFIIGLEDENANLMFDALRGMEEGGIRQHYYVFNTGGVGADTNEEASGPRYKKIPRELTLMLQEALLRDAVKFEYDPVLRSEVAIALVGGTHREVLNLRAEWLPSTIYGPEEYTRRISELSRRRYYGREPGDRAGILRYTKVTNQILSIEDVPPPTNERELAMLLSFFWSVEQAYATLPELVEHTREGKSPSPELLQALADKYQSGLKLRLALPETSQRCLEVLGLRP